jgi:methyl-accepting chemotaxis protein
VKITTKLAASFAAVVLLCAGVGVVGYRAVTSISNSLDDVGSTRLPSVQSLMNIQEGFYGVRAANAALMIEAFPMEKRALQKDFRTACFNDIEKAWAVYEPLPRTVEEDKEWVALVPKFKAWQDAAYETRDAQDAWEKAKTSGASPEALSAAYANSMKKFAAVGTHFASVKESLDKLVDINATDARQATADGRQAAASARTTMIGGVAVAVAVAAALAGLICVNISRSIRALITRITEIRESNDMTRRVDVSAKDEIGSLGAAFNGMIQTLHDIISEVKSGAAQIDAGGSQIASASQSLAQGASEQASSLQQISASIEEMSGQTQQSAENARQANALAEESKKSADRGQAEMAQMSKAVNEIKQSSGEISKIIKVIDEIAFQTNLLALNAAVEAARAGEAGKGFAVVAEEVRNLAQRSAEAAKNTSAMIEESVKRSENGVQIAGRVGQALEEITTAATKVNTLLSEIASAAGEQATGIGQVNQGVSQLDQVTQQNAGNSEEMASSAEELSSQVASLNELVAQFKVSGGTAAAHKAPPAHAATKAKSAAPSQPARKPSAGAAKAAPAAKAGSGVTDPEKIIPMQNDEVLASF